MPEESLDQRLPHKRFILSEESLSIFKDLRSIFKEVGAEKPWIKGLGFFFGSHTIGAETDDSDIDLYVFYDGTQYKEEGFVGKPQIENRQMVIKKTKPKTTRLPQEATKSLLEVGMHQRGWSIPIMRTKDGHDERLFAINISKENTDKHISNFIQAVDANGKISDHFVARFLLGVGDGLYQNRSYIFDQLAKKSNPDHYIRTLSGGLQRFERSSKKQHAVDYKHFPKTLKEAREFFVNKPQNLLTD